MKITDLTDYKFNKMILTEVPEILAILEDELDQLVPYEHYVYVLELMSQIKETHFYLSQELKYMTKTEEEF